MTATGHLAAHDDIHVVFEPVIDVSSGDIIGYEALPLTASAPAAPTVGLRPHADR